MDVDSTLLNYNVISQENVSVVNWIIGIVIMLLVAAILLGGVKRIAKVTEKLEPFMAIIYILLAIGVVVLNIKNVPAVFGSIFYGAFNPAAVTGGVVGSFFLSMTKGVSRGIFSNEAGLGIGSIAHACADTKEPVKQGFFGIFEVFADTIIICTLTAVAMCCFAFSTIIGWGLYGAHCAEFVFTAKIVKPFMVVYSLMAIVGATIDLGLVWSISDTFNGLMVIPNLIAVFLLSGTVFRLVKENFA